MNPLLVRLGAIHGLLGVGLGAFGAHGLRTYLAAMADAEQRLAWWDTGSRYQLVHAGVLLALAALEVHLGPRTRTAGHAINIGIFVFSGSLYAMTLSGVRALGAITPIGGVSLLIGWALVLGASFMKPSTAPQRNAHSA